VPAGHDLGRLCEEDGVLTLTLTLTLAVIMTMTV